MMSTRLGLRIDDLTPLRMIAHVANCARIAARPLGDRLTVALCKSHPSSGISIPAARY
jgi:hypothetical protein